MNVVKGMESVLFLELIRTVKLSVLSVKQDEKSRRIWANQLAYFKHVVQFYMLDLDIKEFKDLRLPSERKAKTKQPKARANKQPLKPRFRAGGKQLQLFFIKTVKHIALSSILFVEWGVQEMESLLFKEAIEFDNNLRS